MNSVIRHAEVCIAPVFGRSECIMTGRATSAIWLALKTLGKVGKVLVPAVMCPNPANAVLYAGCTPRFIDVNTQDYTIDIESLQEALEEPDIVAVLVVHLYGHPARMDRIVELAAEKQLPVIEDVAQAMGGTYKGRPLGSFGDMSILSFNSNKIPGLKGGGALITDDSHIARRARTIVETLPVKPLEASEMQKQYRNLYYAIRDLEKAHIDNIPFYRVLPDVFKQMYLYGPVSEEAKAAQKGMGILEEDVKHRRKVAELYRTVLEHPQVHHPGVNFDESAFWRYTVCFDGDAHKLAEEIRAADIDASNWYPNIAPWYGDTRRLKGAEYTAKHVLNLWTDRSHGIEQVQDECTRIRKIVEGFHG